MRFSKFVVISAILCFFARAAFASTPGANSTVLPMLPKQFAGWQIQGAPQSSQDAAAADPTNAPLLKEYGFNDFEAASYKSEDGRRLKIRAARFADASGAFGAYSFYLQPEMAREDIGDQAASLNQRVLFYRGHVLVDAVFSEMSVMSAAGLRELAGLLPALRTVRSRTWPDSPPGRPGPAMLRTRNDSTPQPGRGYWRGFNSVADRKDDCTVRGQLRAGRRCGPMNAS